MSEQSAGGPPHDPLLLFQTFRRAVADWMEEHRFRFVIPSREYWPDGVDSREESLDHYSAQAAGEIIAAWEERYYRGDARLVCYGSDLTASHEPTEMEPAPLGDGETAHQCPDCGALVKRDRHTENGQ